MTQKKAACCTSMMRPSGHVSRASQKPRSSAIRLASMFPAYDRLLAPDSTCRGESVTKARCAGGQSRYGSRIDDAPAAAREHDAHVGEHGPRPSEERGDLGLELLAREGQTDGGAGPPHAVQMVDERERPAGVTAHELEGAVAAQQAVVVHRDRRLAGVAEHAVDRGGLRRPRGLRIA